MSRVIIGIHGLANKAERNVLRIWWELAITYGMEAAGLRPPLFEFEMIYWADLLYPQPLDPLIEDEEHPLFLSHPFKKVTPIAASEHDERRRRLLDQLERFVEKMLQKESFYNRFERLAEKFVEKRFQDLHLYLTGAYGYGEAAEGPVREVIAERFIRMLQRHRRDSICLVAHSMGSIIAYDMLYHHPELPAIDLLITIGSPLAQPLLMAKLTDVNPVFEKIKTPDAVKRWVNFSDLYDLVAVNYNLRDDYAPNAAGVLPEDFIVHNTYTWEGEPNPHHSFGYLQTPECGRVLYEFLTAGRSRWAVRLSQEARSLRELFFRTTEKMLAAAPTRAENKPAPNDKPFHLRRHDRAGESRLNS